MTHAALKNDPFADLIGNLCLQILNLRLQRYVLVVQGLQGGKRNEEAFREE